MTARTPVQHRTAPESLTSEQIIAVLHANHDALRKFSVHRIGLFGSFAKGQQTQNSDIDFVVEFGEPTFDSYMGLVDFLEGMFARSVDLLTPEGVESIRIKHIAQDIQRNTLYV